MSSIDLHLHTFTTTAITDTADKAAAAAFTTTLAAAQIKPWLAHELARELSLSSPATPFREMEILAHYHNHHVGPNQCCSAVVRRIAAPVPTVWGLVRRFDEPQAYKQFLRSCHVISGDGDHVGCLREVRVVSGLPAGTSTERLEVLDEEAHAIGFRVVGGDHRLHNYRSVTTLHPFSAVDTTVSGEGTVVVESYVVDVPPGNTKEETYVFVETIVGCNLKSLARISERRARSSSSSSSSTTPSHTSLASSCKVS